MVFQRLDKLIKYRRNINRFRPSKDWKKRIFQRSISHANRWLQLCISNKTQDILYSRVPISSFDSSISIRYPNLFFKLMKNRSWKKVQPQFLNLISHMPQTVEKTFFSKILNFSNWLILKTSPLMFAQREKTTSFAVAT